MRLLPRDEKFFDLFSSVARCWNPARTHTHAQVYLRVAERLMAAAAQGQRERIDAEPLRKYQGVLAPVIRDRSPDQEIRAALGQMSPQTSWEEIELALRV